MFRFLITPKDHAGKGSNLPFSGLLVLMFILFSVLPAQAAYEQATDLQAKSILKPELLNGENFTLQEKVKNGHKQLNGEPTY